VAEP
jgi:hypothetical protein